MSADSLEQHFILRVQNPELANKLRGWLRDTETLQGRVNLLFDTTMERVGVLEVDGVQHTVLLQDLPTVVESYKTLDDANLVKIADIGQVLLVIDPEQPLNAPAEAPDGVTPPMRKARSRHFKPRITLPEPLMKDATNDVLEILAGRAPEGYTFRDIEEEYVVDPATGQGRWQQVKPSKARAAATAAAAAAAAAAAEAKPAARRGGRKAANKKGSEDEEAFDDVMTDSD